MKQANLVNSQFFRGKKILVTGGAGFVGTNLLSKLLETDAKIFATIHKTSPQVNNKRVRFIKGDLTSKTFCQKVCIGIDYVFMCAANTSGAAVIQRMPLDLVTPNVIMNTLMLEAAYDAKIKKFLFISSNTVYPMLNHPVKEEEMMSGEPYDKYFHVAWMKRFGELLCEMYSTKIKNPMQTIIIRPGNIYGPFDGFEWETSHVIPALIRKVVERHNPVEVWGDGRDIKDLIFVEDFIEGILLAMEKVTGFVPINIASGKAITVKESLYTILKIDNFTGFKIVFNNSKPSMIPKRLIDTTLAKKLLNFEATTDFKTGIKKTIDWYRTIHKLTFTNNYGDLENTL